MDRATLAAWLAVEYDALLTEASIAPTDTSPGGLAPVLDKVWEWLDVVPDLDDAWLYPLAAYYLLDRIVKRWAVNMDVNTSGDSYKLSQQLANVRTLRDEAYAQVEWLIATPPGVEPDDGIVVYEMPFLTGGEWREEDFTW